MEVGPKGYGQIASDCRHEWQPAKGMGKYRCALCDCVGYRGITTMVVSNGEGGFDATGAWQSSTSRRASQIFAYVCRTKGCHRPAVCYGRRQVCKHCRDGEKVQS